MNKKTIATYTRAAVLQAVARAWCAPHGVATQATIRAELAQAGQRMAPSHLKYWMDRLAEDDAVRRIGNAYYLPGQFAASVAWLQNGGHITPPAGVTIQEQR